MMNQLIGLLLPSIIALKMHNKLEEKEENLKKQIERYLIYVMIVNTISYIITIYIFKQPNIVFTYLFTVKYVILALVVSIIIPVIEKFILTNMEVEIKVEKNEEKTHSIYNNIEEQKKDTENIIQSNIITEEDAIKKAKNILEEYGFKNEEIKTIEFENNIESDMALWKVKTESNIYIEFDARGGDYFNIDISNNTYWLKYVNKYDLIYVRDVRRKIL